MLFFLAATTIVLLQRIQRYSLVLTGQLNDANTLLKVMLSAWKAGSVILTCQY